MFKSPLRIVNQIDAKFPLLQRQEPVDGDRAHIPQNDSVVLHAIHVQVKNEFEQAFSIQVIKPYHKQVDLAKVSEALESIGIEGELVPNTFVMQNLTESSKSLVLPLSEDQSSTTVFDSELFVDTTLTYIMSGDDFSYELTYEQLSQLYCNRVLVASVTISENNLSQTSGKTISGQFHAIDHQIGVSSVSIKRSETPLFALLAKKSSTGLRMSARAQEELIVLMQSSVINGEIRSSFVTGLVDIINAFPSVYFEFFDMYYSKHPKNNKTFNIAKMIKEIGLFECFEWVDDLANSAIVRDNAMIKNATFMTQSDFAVIRDAAIKLADKLEDQGRLEVLELDRDMFIHMACLRFYGFSMLFNILKVDHFLGFANHVMYNRQFDYASLVHGYLGLNLKQAMKTLLRNANHPEDVIAIVDSMNTMHEGHEGDQYNHIIDCLIVELESNNKLRLTYSDSIMKFRATEFSSASYAISEEVASASSAAGGLAMFEHPPLIREIEENRNRIDLAYYKVS